MTDDLDDLKRLLNEATPPPDPAKKAEHLALAQKNFARFQESANRTRPTSERPATGLFRGVTRMFANLTTRGALTATTALVALGLVIALPQMTNRPLPDLLGTSEGTTTPKPVATPLRDEREAKSDAEPAPPLPKPVEERETLADAPMSAAPDGEGAAIGRLASKPTSTRQLERNAQSAQNNGYTNDYIQQPYPSGAIAPAPSDQVAPPLESNTEAFPEADQNPLKITAEDPVSTFSIDVDTASYAVVRSSIMAGHLPPHEAVRIEEMINYFPYDYPAPGAGEAPFKPTVTVMPTPWNQGTELVHIALQGRAVATDNRPPLNLVFLIDTSGSMDQANKLPLLKQSLALMLPRLNEADQVSIVTYAGSAGQVLAPTPASQHQTILAALDNLRAGGSTAGQAGLQQAYAVAEGMAQDGEVTRVILATDGDFNVGLSNPDALKNYIAEKRDSGTYLSVMGFGRGNLDDATMQALAQNGNGHASYIDTLSEAQKVLVDQFAGALFPIANDVKIQVEFNPAQVSEYRLIGYETRALKREDFNNDKVDAGDIGAGHSVTAIYEITPTDSPARLTDPLRYGTTTAEGIAKPSAELGFLKLRYKAPGTSSSQLIETPILPGAGQATNDMRFATTIAGFGQLLQDSAYTGDWSFDDAIALATASRGDDPFGYRAEAVRLMRLAASLAH